jgi:hypothetical protein
MIDMATAHIPNADRGCVALFSAGYSPDAQIVLGWQREEGGGDVFRRAERWGGLAPPGTRTLRFGTAAKHIVQMKAPGEIGEGAAESV